MSVALGNGEGRGGGVAVRVTAEAYNLLFTPKILPTTPTLTFSSVLHPPPLFHSPFCLHRGMNFKHSASHLSFSSQNRTTHSLFPAHIQHCGAFSPLTPTS